MHSILTTASDHLATTSAAIVSDGLVIFKVMGDVQIYALSSECYTSNDATASRFRYGITSKSGVSDTFSGQTASLANAVAGTVIALDNTTLSSAPTVSTTGIALGIDSRGIRVPSGEIKITVSGGSTTGTWRHYIRYEPLENGAYITEGF